MRSFTESEQAVIRQLATWRQGQPGLMEDFLTEHVFTAQSPRAVIIQTQRRYAVLYRGGAAAAGKPSATDRPFFELLALLAYLRGNGYLALYNNSRREDRKTLYYLHASFDNPRVEGNTIFLNNAGDFTNHPEVILDKSYTLKFKGTLLEADLYDLVLGNMTGTVCVSQGLLELLGPPRPPRGLRGLEWHKIAIAALVCANLILSYFAFRAHAAISSVATSVEGLRNQQAELTRKMPPVAPKSGAATTPADGSKQEYYGVDISRWNGNFSQEIDQIPRLSFAISKATEGLTLRDDQFQNNRKLLQARGVVHGGYHLFRQDDDPVAQAEFFLTTVEPLTQGDIAPVVDVENASLTQHPQASAASLEAAVLLMLKTLESRTGRSPILYTNLEFAQKYFASTEFAHYRLWLAEYTLGQPEIPNVWRSSGYFIWQKSASYKVGASEIDLDVYQGDKTELTR